MIVFQLFRVKVYPPDQPSLFSQEFVPQLVLVEAIRSKPAFELKRGHRWHIGNVEQLDSFGMYFALGRTTRSTIELYDEASGDFVEEEFETAPYTHVICDNSLEVPSNESQTFWRWFFRGKGRPGWRKFVDRWLIVHGATGLLLAALVPGDLKTAASTVLLPLVGVLIGLSFAWAGNAQALLQTEEIEQLSEYHPRGFEEYAYTYQAAILIILASVVLWGIAGLGVFDLHCAWNCSDPPYFLVKSFLYFFSSLTIRECWHVVLGAQMMLLSRRAIRRAGKTARRHE